MEPAPTERAIRQAEAGTEMPRFAVVDLETSGLSVRRHRILQIAVVTVHGDRVVDEWESYVKLSRPWQRVGPRRVHGITRSTLRGAPSLHDVMAEFSQRSAGTVLVAHNVRFDWPFLERAARRSDVALDVTQLLCTLQLSRRLDPDRARSHRLGDVAERYGVVNHRPHDALEDARTTALVLPHLLAGHGVASPGDLDGLYEPS